MGSIRMGNLDTRVIVGIKNLLYTSVYNQVHSFDCTKEDFVNALDSGIRDNVINVIKDYYNFIGDIEVELTDSELFELYKSAV